jgi:hypothetical protein
MPRAKRSMTAAEFEAVRHLLNISDERVEAARLALVGGHTNAGIAKQFGWKSRQAVGECVDAVWQALQRYREAQKAQASAGSVLPQGYEMVTLAAPVDLIDKWRSELAVHEDEKAVKVKPSKAEKSKRD